MNSLKNRFLLLFIFIIISIAILSWNNNYLSTKIVSFDKELSDIKELQISILQMRRMEKDFFLRKNDIYKEKLLALYKLNKEKFVKAQLETSLKVYRDNFVEISDKMKYIGYSHNDGLQKEFRDYAHKLENIFIDQENTKHLVDILQLRRHEKDFLLRLDIKYVQRHQTLFEKIQNSKDINKYSDDLLNYNNTFLKLVSQMKIIGLDETSALRLRMRTSAHDIEYKLNDYIVKKTRIVKQKIQYLKYKQYMFYFIFVFLIIGLLILFLKPISKAFLLFQAFFTDFKDASQRVDIDKLKFKELRETAITLNKMLANREKIEKDLINSTNEAIRLQKVKEQFLTNMSHELRTPLNAIIGFSSILKNDCPDEGKKINPIVDSSKHLLSIINDILDLSKIQSGKFVINKEEFEIKEKLNTCLTAFNYSIDAKGINFTLESNIEDKLYLNNDWLRISQVLNNLLSNAIKFTPQGGEITLGVNFKDNVLEIYVKDSGIGMSDEEKRRVLKPFEQADSSTTKVYGGTGLGLSISNAIINMLDGALEIQSKSGQGSTFSFKIPVEKLDKEDAVVLEVDNGEINFSVHILIAEDNKTNQILLQMLLEDIGITCDVANDGLEAVKMYQDDKYKLVLMDENMPNMNGIDAMLKIRQEHSSVVPIIAVTANVMKGDESRLLEAGMDGFIPKPIDTKELIEVISFFLKKK